jgi:5-methyltetrahydropteroyltriglutamate--homocysteine methyltransferase
MKIHNLGFPRIGAKRQLKFLLENYWAGRLTKEGFIESCKQQRRTNWLDQKKSGIEILPVGDFAHYDQVLNTTMILGAIPQRFEGNGDQLDVEFRIARGKAPSGCSCSASDMTKWFDTNYHYIVPELDENTKFSVDLSGLLAQITEAKSLTSAIKPVIIGPLTYLYLSAGDSNEKLQYLPKLLSAYQTILQQLSQADIEWLQIDEPILGLELPEQWLEAFSASYQVLNKGRLKILLATYFASVDHVIDEIKQWPIDGLHLDTIAEQSDIENIVNILPAHWVVSLGIVDGRNIWKTDLLATYQKYKKLAEKLDDRLWLAPSCSLLHSPVDLEQETKLATEVKSWLAFAKQKCQELALLKVAFQSGNTDEITQYSAICQTRKTSILCQNLTVQARVKAININEIHRAHSFAERKVVQQKKLNLPDYPTTTIGSFPQTGDIRQIRSQWRNNVISELEYQQLIKKEIKHTIEKQEALELDVLVHGEAERNDMVEYFGEQFNGVAFSQFGWVQSYGSRCVKPPIIFGDVSRKQSMTLDWIKYAQSLTNKPVKAMLTGPITILSWSFIRDDIPRKDVTLQIALAIGDEVQELEANGSAIIQIDEPAIREAMPLKTSQWQEYLHWATAAFRLTTVKVNAQTQIHSHMCYSEFNEIMQAIINLDADVLTVETSRSNMQLLDAFEQQAYPNDLGPGVYDIHSPNVPSVEWITNLVTKAEQYIPKERLWINPDCGLKTRAWQETELALANMVSAAKQLRAKNKAVINF